MKFLIPIVALLLLFDCKTMAHAELEAKQNPASCAASIHPHSALIDVIDLAKNRSIVPDNRGGIAYRTPWSHSRQISLPPVLTEWHRNWKKDPKPVFAISALGNSGARYEKTWHNLGYRLLTLLAQDQRFSSRTLMKSSLAPSTTSETLKVTYNSLFQEREWEETFRTLRFDHRTDTGEVFLLEKLQYRIVLVRPFGDYNEMGDFIVPILKYLEIPTQNFLLLRDEARAPLMVATHIDASPALNQGNKGIESINRNLALGLVAEISDVITDFAIANKYEMSVLPETYLREGLLNYFKPMSRAKMENLIRYWLSQIFKPSLRNLTTAQPDLSSLMAKINQILNSHFSFHQMTLGSEAQRYVDLDRITNPFSMNALVDFNLSHIGHSVSESEMNAKLLAWERQVWATLESIAER